MKTVNTVNKIDLPVLKDVIVHGKNVQKTNELSLILDDLQTQALQQQIEKIIQTRLEEVLEKASQEVITEIKAYLDNVLPKLIKSA